MASAEMLHQSQQTPAFTGTLAFCSNFYPSPIRLGQLIFPSVEHLFQAAKGDRSFAERVIGMTAGQAKRAARSLPLDLPGWNEYRIPLMFSLLEAKFSNPALRQMLRETGPILLVERNYWNDTFWGTCDGVGENHLGAMLTTIREHL